MADFTKTITNSVNPFGLGPSTKWGQSVFGYTMTWGTAKWLGGLTSSDSINRVKMDFINVVIPSIAPSSTISNQLSIYRTISFSMSPGSDVTQRTLQDGTLSWYYVFAGNTTNADSQSIPTWGETASSVVTYVCQSTSTITWSSS